MMRVFYIDINIINFTKMLNFQTDLKIENHFVISS
jgi:hypothetical protein